MTQLAMGTLLAALLEERAGLHYRENERVLLVEKVTSRANDAGYESLLDYYYFLRYDPEGPAELERLVERVVVGETYFFRELDQLKLIVERWIAPAVAEGRRPRIWSAACATGEEPLSIAMMLADRGILGSVDIVASDVSQRALDYAQAGIFGRRSQRDYNAGLLRRSSRNIDGDKLEVNRPLIDAVSWRRINLIDEAAVGALGKFDVILCRNVLIYFSDATITQVVDRLGRALAPNGVLFVGVTESLYRIGTQLVCEERDRVFFYRNPT
jgi:chemotaxis protein methyltransferase CheR